MIKEEFGGRYRRKKNRGLKIYFLFNAFQYKTREPK